MAYTDPGTEAELLSTVNSDIDRYRGKYKTKEDQVNGDVINISFVSPTFKIFDDYRFFILQNCTKKKVSLSNMYRPDYVSYEEYGTTNWWQLLMYINNIPSLDQFTKEEILVPNKDCIYKLEEMASKGLEFKDFNEDSKANKTNALLYVLPVEKTKLETTLSELTRTEPSSESVDSSSDRFKREDFVMDIPTLRLRYIELEHEPINNSIILIIRGKPNYTYGKHYQLVDGSKGKNRITWDPTIVKGSGLIFRLKEKDIIQVTYVAK